MGCVVFLDTHQLGSLDLGVKLKGKVTRLPQVEKTSLPSRIIITMIMHIFENGITWGNTPS